MMRSSAHNRFGDLMGTSWPTSCPRWYGLREDSLPMITLFLSQGDFCATAKGHGDKAIGFCVSIKHAERMAEVFRDHGILAAAIHSEAADRDALLAQFRADKLQVAFTVDLFNEGV